jgi:hypothetical protein
MKTKDNLPDTFSTIRPACGGQTGRLPAYRSAPTGLPPGRTRAHGVTAHASAEARSKTLPSFSTALTT